MHYQSNKKKYFPIIASLIFILTLSGCGNKKDITLDFCLTKPIKNIIK